MTTTNQPTIRTITPNGKRFQIDVSEDRPFADIADEVAAAYWEAFEGSGRDDNEIMELAEAAAERIA